MFECFSKLSFYFCTFPDSLNKYWKLKIVILAVGSWGLGSWIFKDGILAADSYIPNIFNLGIWQLGMAAGILTVGSWILDS